MIDPIPPVMPSHAFSTQEEALSALSPEMLARRNQVVQALTDRAMSRGQTRMPGMAPVPVMPPHIGGVPERVGMPVIPEQIPHIAHALEQNRLAPVDRHNQRLLAHQARIDDRLARQAALPIKTRPHGPAF